MWSPTPVPFDDLALLSTVMAGGESVPVRTVRGTDADVRAWIDEARGACVEFQAVVRRWLAEQPDAAGGRAAFVDSVRRLAG